MTYERLRLLGTDPRPGLQSDRSRGVLPPAENLQYEPAAPHRKVWPVTIGLCAFVLGLALLLVLR